MYNFLADIIRLNNEIIVYTENLGTYIYAINNNIIVIPYACIPILYIHSLQLKTIKVLISGQGFLTQSILSVLKYYTQRR